MKINNLYIYIIAFAGLLSIHGTVSSDMASAITFSSTTVEGEIGHGLTVYDVNGQIGTTYDLTLAAPSGNTLLMRLDDPTQPAIMVVKPR